LEAKKKGTKRGGSVRGGVIHAGMLVGDRTNAHTKSPSWSGVGIIIKNKSYPIFHK